MTDVTTTKRGLGALLLAGGLLTLIPAAQGQGIGLKKFGEMLVPTEQKIQRGRIVYERQCITCHGAQGRNDTEWAKENGLTGSLTDGNYTHGGGPIQIYNLLSQKQEGVNHPVYSSYVPYQDRWAVTHYTRSLSKTTAVDPPTVVAQAEKQAVLGICRDDVKETIETTSKFKGEEQIARGKEVYEANCSSCHGLEGLGNGPAAGAIQGAPPRNFVQAEYEQWTNGVTPLAIFNTLAQGIKDTSMAAYTTLPEEDRWALTHYVRGWVPKEIKEKAKEKASPEEEIIQTCRSLSAPPKAEPIDVERAMRFLVRDATNARDLKRQSYGPVWRYEGASLEQGQQKYAQYCAGCHGMRGEGKNTNSVGPYGAMPPFLYLEVGALKGLDAGGSVEQFATRSAQGVHSTLPDMTGADMLSTEEWQGIQLYVSSFDPKPEFIESTMARSQQALSTTLVATLDDQGTLRLGDVVVTEEDLVQVMQSPAKAGFTLQLQATRQSDALTAAAGRLTQAGIKRVKIALPKASAPAQDEAQQGEAPQGEAGQEGLKPFAPPNRTAEPPPVRDPVQEAPTP